MKVRAYIRVAKGGPGNKYKLSATTKPDNTPLYKLGYGRSARRDFLPTVSFAVDFDLPEDAFNRAAKVISEVVVRSEDVGFATEIV